MKEHKTFTIKHCCHLKYILEVLFVVTTLKAYTPLHYIETFSQEMNVKKAM